MPTLGWGAAAGFGVVVGTAAQLGDLMESMIKRDCARKDASDAVPGFGGVLDVLDSLLFAAPVAFGYWLHVRALSGPQLGAIGRPLIFPARFVHNGGVGRPGGGEPVRGRGCVGPGPPPAGLDEGHSMPEVTISLDNHDEELAVFGSRDQFLRQVRDALGVKVLARHGEVRVEGEDDRVEQARQVFEGLRGLYRRQRAISLGRRGRRDRVGPGRRRARRLAPPSRSARAAASSAPGPTARRATSRPSATTSWSSASARPARARRTWPWPTPWRPCARAKIKKIVLVRPAVEAGEHLGFLPGDLEAKINPYLRPLLDALHDLMDYDQIRRYMGNDLIEIAPLAYMRGRTLNDAVIILDEGQNATVPQMKMFLTRMGQNSRIVVTGDTTQVDLPAGTVSGLADAVDRLRRRARGSGS